MAARGEVETGVRVLQRPGRADLHPAQGVHRLHEAGEVDLQVVVDLDARQLFDGPHGQTGPALGVGGVQLQRVGGVRLAGVAVLVLGDLGVAVAGQRDDARALLVRRQMHQHDGVGAVARRTAQPVLLLLLRGDPVAAVGAHQQQIHAVAGPGPVLHVLERVDPVDPGLQAGHHRVADPTGPEHQHGDAGHQSHAPAGPLVLPSGPALRRNCAGARRTGEGCGLGTGGTSAVQGGSFAQ